jgi:hypothetical protein
MHGDAVAGQLARHQIGGAMFGEADFRMGVDVATDRGEVVVPLAE